MTALPRLGYSGLRVVGVHHALISMSAAILLTCLSAALYAASFPPLSLGFLGWVALAPWLLASLRVTPGRAALLGGLWGVLTAYGVAWWLPAMISGYFEQPWYVGWLGFLLITATLFAGYFAVFGAWLSWAGRRAPIGPLLVGAAWVACELARSRLFIGNPWALSGYSQVGSSSLMQIADATGPYGVAFLVASVNAAVAGLVIRELRGGAPWTGRAAVLASLALALVYGHGRLTQTFATGDEMRVALVQGAVERGYSWRDEYRSVGLGRYLALTRATQRAAPDLIVWPEQAVSFYPEEPSPETDALFAGTRRLDADLIMGGPHYSEGVVKTSYHNSIFLLRDGEIAARYDKQKLLPVAEQPVLGGLADHRTSYTSGSQAHVLTTRSGSVGAFVCFEAMYPELVRQFAASGAEVLANLSNDVWFQSDAAAQHHLDMASVRAIENRRFLLRASGSGISAIVDPHGRIVAETGIGEAGALAHTIRTSHARTWYQLWGDLPAWLAVAGVLWATMRRGKLIEMATTGVRPRRPQSWLTRIT